VHIWSRDPHHFEATKPCGVPGIESLRPLKGGPLEGPATSCTWTLRFLATGVRVWG